MTPQWQRSIFLLCFPAMSAPESGCERENGGLICYGCVRWSIVRSNSNSIVLSASFFPVRALMDDFHCSESTYIKRATTTTTESMSAIMTKLLFGNDELNKKRINCLTQHIHFISMAKSATRAPPII